MSEYAKPWVEADRELPPEGVVVETISEGGTPGVLKRSGRLWFLPDDWENDHCIDCGALITDVKVWAESE